jgi:hypothetical protein
MMQQLQPKVLQPKRMQKLKVVVALAKKVVLRNQQLYKKQLVFISNANII